jgi:hypothetical protein
MICSVPNVKTVWIIGNQVRILSDPVTVSRESSYNDPLGLHVSILLIGRLEKEYEGDDL